VRRRRSCDPPRRAVRGGRGDEHRPGDPPARRGRRHRVRPLALWAFWDNDLLDPDFNKFNDLVQRVEPVATLVDATDGDLVRSPRYQRLYADIGATDELRVALMTGTTCLAISAFVRCGGTFNPTETSDVRNLLVPAAAVLRQALVTDGPSMPGMPATILLDGEGRPVSRSEGAEAVLADLRGDVDGEIPATVLVAAWQARTAAGPRPVSTRLRGRSGRWVRLVVTPMDGEAELVAVTIDHATPSDLAPILLSSYDLTAREADIVMALCRGLATKQIATELGIATHRVHDHLKAIYLKTGVHARGELVARLFTSHMRGPFEERVTHA
jgi:DNA-binding NarL/FixJ family response regulator